MAAGEKRNRHNNQRRCSTAEQFCVRVEAPAKATEDSLVPPWGEFVLEIGDVAARGYRIVATVTRNGTTVAVITGRAL